MREHSKSSRNIANHRIGALALLAAVMLLPLLMRMILLVMLGLTLMLLMLLLGRTLLLLRLLPRPRVLHDGAFRLPLAWVHQIGI